MNDFVVDGDKAPYPDSTPDFVKVLREAGFEAEFAESREDRRYVGHKAADVWLPILTFAGAVFSGAAGTLLAELIKGYLGDTKDALLHIDWRVQGQDGREERFRADGKAADVLQAADEFEQRLRNDPE